MDTNYIIETKNLTKQYGSQKSVADLNIHVKRGRIYGLLGRNVFMISSPLARAALYFSRDVIAFCSFFDGKAPDIVATTFYHKIKHCATKKAKVKNFRRKN